MHARLFMHWNARRCKIGHNIEKRGVRAAVVSALDMLSTKRTQRLPKKHGNMTL